MLLQEEIIFEEYFRCYCIGGKHVRIMQYDPRNPHHLRYATEGKSPDPKLLKTVEEYTLKLCKYLGYDFNTVEFAVRDGVPIAIDFCNPAPDADIKSVGQENFDWVVETTANYAIERAKAQKDGQDNLTWGEYIKASVGGKPLIAKAESNVAKTVTPKKITATEKAKTATPEKAPAKPKKAAAKK
ncbi:hypothetical protein [Pedobacter sp. P26]